MEKGWHGYPAVMTRRLPGVNSFSAASQSIVVMSPRFGTSGWWCASTRQAAGSISE